jgi:hypothetical protein
MKISPAQPRSGGFAPASADPFVRSLAQIDRKLLDLARDVRNLRIDLEREAKSRGVLGDRGFTQFILNHLEENSGLTFTTYRLTQIARAAGYATPNTVSLTKRLSEHRRRTGKILSTPSGWQWNTEQQND